MTHFDLANNYGGHTLNTSDDPVGKTGSTGRRTARPSGTSAASCATTCGRYRDELIISTKAGYDMWPGPYGDWGSRKYLLASLDQSLARMGLDYVDIFYSHRADPDTPLEETMGALATAVTSGRALYAGISSYSAERTAQAAAILRQLGTPLLIHQPSYSMLNRWIEDGLLDTLAAEGAQAASRSRRSRRACSPASTSAGIPAVAHARARAARLTPRSAERGEPGAGLRPQRDRRAAAASRWRRWR